MYTSHGVSTLQKIRYRRCKTPTMIQMEATECGAVCLGIILGYLKKFVPVEELRKVCGISRDGSTAYNIVKAAKFYGLEASGFHTTVEDLFTTDLPAILHWNEEHFVVLEGFSKKYVYLNDPARGPCRISYETLRESFSGTVLIFEKTSSFQTGGKQPSFFDLVSTWLKDEKKIFLYTFLVGIILTLANLFLVYSVKLFVDQAIVANHVTLAYWVIGGLIFATLLSSCMSAMQSYLLNRWNARISIKIAAQLLQKMFHLPREFYTQRYPGEIAYRMSLVQDISHNLTESLSRITINILLVFVYAIALLFYSVPISLVVFVGTGLNALCWLLIARRREDDYACYQANTSKNNAYSLGGLRCIETIKALGSEYSFFATWSGLYSKVINISQNINKKDILIDVISPTIQSIMTIIVLFLSVIAIMDHQMTVGIFLALRILIGLFTGPVYALIDFGKNIQLLKVDLARLNDVFNYESDTLVTSQKEVEKSLGKNVSSVKLEGFIDLMNVNFSFSEVEPPILKNIYLSLKPGQTFALVGSTGCGKSTLAYILAGLYSGVKGDIFFDQIPFHQVPRYTFTNSVSLVEQDPFLFCGTIKDNITMFNTLVSEVDVIQAAKDACIHDDITQRGGYEVWIEENGMNLSGGQRQRIELARALVKNPSILIMDESTSALDSLTESEIIKNIHRRGCTILMIAHRLSTIKNCDQIFIMDKGEIINTGTHDELLNIQGIYRELIESEKNDSE